MVLCVKVRAGGRAGLSLVMSLLEGVGVPDLGLSLIGELGMRSLSSLCPRGVDDLLGRSGDLSGDRTLSK